jgi:ceramide glucosyltransferase
VLTFCLIVAVIGTISSWIYCLLAQRAAAHFKKTQAAVIPKQRRQPISVLKPVHGEESGLEENLVTFFEQNHPDFELLFCARTLDNPALNVVRRLASRFPHVRTRIIASGEPAWPNARAFSVNALIAQASNPTVVITDSDVRVDRNFLSEVVGPISEPEVGLVTCLYRGVSLGGLPSDLEALGMSVELMSNVLIANMLNGMDFALGPATATTRAHIDRIGGLQESGLYYADDFALGNIIDQSGLQVVLSPAVIEHVVPKNSLLSSLRHQLLWMKNNRYLRPRGHIGVGLTFAMPYAMLGCCASWMMGHHIEAFAWLLSGIINCLTRSILIGWGVVSDPAALHRAWLYPLRDLLGFGVWLSAWFGNKIHFRGDQYILLHSGKVQRVSS